MADTFPNNTIGDATYLGVLANPLFAHPNGTVSNFLEFDSVSSVAETTTDPIDYFEFTPYQLKDFSFDFDQVKPESGTFVFPNYVSYITVTFSVGKKAESFVFIETGGSGSDDAIIRNFASIYEGLYGNDNVFINDDSLTILPKTSVVNNADGNNVIVSVVGNTTVYDDDGLLLTDPFEGTNYTLNIYYGTHCDKKPAHQEMTY